MSREHPDRPSIDVRTPLVAPTQHGQHLLMLVDQLERAQGWSREALEEYQLGLMGRLLAHAYETVPFYRARLADVGYRPGQPTTRELWRQLPVLTRSEVQDQRDALKSTKMPPDHGSASKVTTSGSTGMPLTVWRSAQQALILQAIVLRKLIWAGCDFRLKFGAVVPDPSGGASAPAGGHSPDWAYPAALAYETGPAVSIDIRSAPDDIADWLVREAPDYLNIGP